jgi:hypothetical protein
MKDQQNDAQTHALNEFKKMLAELPDVQPTQGIINFNK